MENNSHSNSQRNKNDETGDESTGNVDRAPSDSESDGADNESRTCPPDAEFLGWQETVTGNVVPLFNIVTPGHSYYGSTVTEQTLRNLNLQLPELPDPPKAQ